MTNNPTNITDNQWKSIEHLFENQRKHQYSLQEILNTLFFITKTDIK